MIIRCKRLIKYEMTVCETRRKKGETKPNITVTGLIMREKSHTMWVWVSVCSVVAMPREFSKRYVHTCRSQFIWLDQGPNDWQKKKANVAVTVRDSHCTAAWREDKNDFDSEAQDGVEGVDAVAEATVNVKGIDLTMNCEIWMWVSDWVEHIHKARGASAKRANGATEWVDLAA